MSTSPSFSIEHSRQKAEICRFEEAIPFGLSVQVSAIPYKCVWVRAGVIRHFTPLHDDYTVQGFFPRAPLLRVGGLDADCFKAACQSPSTELTTVIASYLHTSYSSFHRAQNAFQLCPHEGQPINCPASRWLCSSASPSSFQLAWPLKSGAFKQQSWFWVAGWVEELRETDYTSRHGILHVFHVILNLLTSYSDFTSVTSFRHFCF